MSKLVILEKDYLNVKEAALYMGVSESGFVKMAKTQRIPCGKVPRGKKLYRRSDLKKLNERYFDAEVIDEPPKL